MPRCFVIQPFDDGPFDRRYSQIFDPAIRKAGLEPYRVDQDLSADNLMERIEQEIRTSRVCLADITEDNPNVWFELGYAMALPKPVVMVCGDQRRTNFPFDIRHRMVIKYSRDSPDDFQRLEISITQALQERIKEQVLTEDRPNPEPPNRDHQLPGHEVATLGHIASLVSDPHEGVTVAELKEKIMHAGFHLSALPLALSALIEKEFIYLSVDNSFYGGPVKTYTITEYGWAWLRKYIPPDKLRRD